MERTEEDTHLRTHPYPSVLIRTRRRINVSTYDAPLIGEKVDRKAIVPHLPGWRKHHPAGHRTPSEEVRPSLSPVTLPSLPRRSRITSLPVPVTRSETAEGGHLPRLCRNSPGVMPQCVRMNLCRCVTFFIPARSAISFMFSL